MTEITSPQNQRLKALRKLHTRRGRAASGRFMAEGEDLLAAAARAGREPVEGYRLAGTAIGGAAFVDVEQALMREISSLGSGTRAIGVYEQRWGSARGPLCVYLHGVGDPGNVGTVLRSAHAFGASSVALGPNCADPHSPKAVRASMGAIFAVELARAGSPAELPGRRIALSADASEPLRGGVERAAGGERESESGGRGGAASEREGDGRRDGVTLLIGAERDGLPADVVAACEQHARIPIASESLNAAMAATVALYEMTRDSSRVRAS